MGAIKEGDDPADYKYEWNPKVAIPVGIGGGLMATAAGLTVLTGLAYFGYYKLDDLTRKYSRRRRPKRFGSIKGMIPKRKKR